MICTLSINNLISCKPKLLQLGASVVLQPFVKRRIFQHGEGRPYSDRIKVTFTRTLSLKKWHARLSHTSTICSFHSVRSCITIRSLIRSSVCRVQSWRRAETPKWGLAYFSQTKSSRRRNGEIKTPLAVVSRARNTLRVSTTATITQIPDVSSKDGAVIGAVLSTRKFHRGHH
jgi:hypothetical protein